MKICLVATHVKPLPVESWGGIECQVQAQARGLATQDHEVHVFTVGPQAPCNRRIDGVNYHAVAAPPPAGAGLFASLGSVFGFGWRVHRRLHELEPDLVHYHVRYPALLSLLLDMARPGLWRNLFHVHNCWRAAEQMALPRWSKRWFVSLVAQWLDRFVVRRCDHVVTISSFMKAQIESTSGIDPDKVDIVTNIVDVETFTPKTEPTAEPLILFIGRMAAEKGVLPLIEAMPSVLDAHPRARLRLIGPARHGSEFGAYLLACRRRVVELDLTRHVEFAGEIANQDLPEALHAARVLVVPSVCAEPLGVAALEGLACGVPIVASRVGGLQDLIRDGETGVLVPPGDPRALARAIGQVLSDDALCARAAQAGPRFIAKQHTWGAIAAPLHDLYRRVAARPAMLPAETPLHLAQPREPHAMPEFGRRRERVRILLLLSSTSGGTGLHALYLAQYIDRSRFDLTIGFGPGYPLDEEIAKLGIPTIHFSIARSLSPARNLRGAIQLWHHLRHNRYDILCVGNAMAGLMGRVIGWMVRIPARVFVIHAFASHEHQAWLKVRAYRLIEQALDLVTTRYVAVAEAMKQFGVERGIMVPEKVDVIHNGIPAPPAPELSRAEARASLGLNPEGIVIGTLARFEKQKGLHVLLAAAARLHRRKCRFELLIAGDGPLNSDLRDRAERLGIASITHFPGWRKDAGNVLKALDVFCMPSLWEAMPFSLLETLAAGVPVVASRVDGIPEVITDGWNGLLVEPHNTDALADAIARLIKDTELRRRLAEAGQRSVAERFNVETMVHRYEALFENLATRVVPVSIAPDHSGEQVLGLSQVAD